MARSQTAATPIDRQALDDAWWTGPILANSAATLPHGHILIEPYLYDVMAPRSNGFGTSAYMLYGLRNDLTVGLIPIASYAVRSGGQSSSRVGLGDLTLLAQYRLTQFRAGDRIPAMAVNVQQSFPTAPYDRLGGHPADGFGSGAYTTTMALNTQTYLWLPNGRIVRVRVDVSEALSSGADVADVSVYGTSAGFLGHVQPGSAFAADAAGEYSLTKQWVVALDLFIRHESDTRVTGTNTKDANGAAAQSVVERAAGRTTSVGFAPAIEYNWRSYVGVIVGARVITASRNTTGTITPVVAINFVH
ncbi:MAG: transporter [Gemmatimonadales bacterium]